MERCGAPGRRAMLRRFLTWVSGPILALFFLWLCFRGVSVRELVSHLYDCHPGLLLLSASSVVVHLALRSWRWRTLLAPVSSRLPYRELFSATSIGYMASLLPGRVGEVLRPALLNRRTGIPFAPVLATVGVERAVLDLLAVLVSGGLGLLLPSRISGIGAAADPALLAQLRGAGGLVLAGGGAALVVTVVIARRRDRLHDVVESKAESLPRWLRAVAGWFASLLPGLASFASWRTTARLIVETAAVWLVIGLGIQAGLAATDVGAPPGAFLIMLPVLAVGIGIPTPGGTGTYHLAMMLGLSRLFGVDEAAALSAGFVIHAMTWLPVLLLGGVFVALGGLGRSGPAPAGAVARESAR